MNTTLQQHSNPEWPECWLYYPRGDVAANGELTGNIHVHLGSRTAQSRSGALTYSCRCGATFSRLPGERNEEARSWVSEHRRHEVPSA